MGSHSVSRTAKVETPARFSLSATFVALIAEFRGIAGICSTCHKEFEPHPTHPAYDTTCDECAESRITL